MFMLSNQGFSGFIFDQSTAVDDFGLTEVHAKNTRNKGRNKSKVAKRKAVQKSVFVFNRAARTSQAYENYFNPDPDIESCLLGVSDLVFPALYVVNSFSPRIRIEDLRTSLPNNEEPVDR